VSKFWTTAKHEFYKALPQAIFFFVTFHIVVLERALMAKEYGIRLSSTVGATVRSEGSAPRRHAADRQPLSRKQEDQHDEPNLDAPEMGPHDLAPEVLVGGPKAPHAPPHRDEVLQVVHEHRRDDVD
jgi:hypothetical protein